MKSLGARFAPAVNRVFARRGAVLKTPTQVRNALRYVLMNARRQMKRAGGPVRIDPASSGRWFNGWKPSARAVVLAPRGRPGIQATAYTRTWLLTEGWKKVGALLDPAAVPG